MALVFDLDETLLVANTNSSLENRIEDCKRQRSVTGAELSGRGGKGRSVQPPQCRTHPIIILTALC